MVFILDMKEFIARVAQVEKEMGEEEKKETEEKTEIKEDVSWMMTEFVKKLLKETGMENLKDIRKYSPTKAGYRGWSEKYRGSYEEFLTLYNFALKIYGEWSSF